MDKEQPPDKPLDKPRHKPRNKPRDKTRDSARDKGYQKVARFLMLLSKEEASKVMKHLSEQEVAGITQEIAGTTTIDRREAAKILEEFGYLMKTKDLVARGGIEKARDILFAAFGQERGSTILKKIEARTAPHPFAFLMDLELEQVNLLLKNESGPVLAVILPHLKAELAAELITRLPVEKQKDVAARIARLDKIDPEVLRRAEAVLKEKVRTQGQIVTREVDGMSVLAEILKQMDPGSERRILSELKLQDESLARDLDKRLYSPDILITMMDRDLQAVLREFSERELALLMKGLDERQRERLAANVSSRRLEMIQAEAEALGPVFRSEIDRAVGEFIDYLRLEEEKGNISLPRREDQIVL